MKVLNFEDNIFKHMDIVKALNNIGITDIVHVDNAVEGLNIINKYPQPSKAFNLIITDMWFPWNKGGSERKSGDMVIMELKNMGIYTPIIICSTGGFSNEYALGSVLYSANVPWEEELYGLINIL